MIILDLRCDKGHRFEGWFASSEAFRDQRDRHMVGCPHCDSSSVSQLPSAPYVRRANADSAQALARENAADSLTPDAATSDGATTEKGAVALPNALPDTAQKLFTLLASMARLSENVGDRFPEEARRIHYDEAPARNIRGVATAEEALELMEEGIFVLPVPPENEVH